MSRVILQKLERQFFANLPCSHAQEALALVKTANRFTETRKSIAGRQRIYDCADDSDKVEFCGAILLDFKAASQRQAKVSTASRTLKKTAYQPQ